MRAERGCRIIAISGTPGVGKSSAASGLSRALGAPVVELSSLVVEEGLYSGYDAERASYVVDEHLLRKRILKLSEECGRSGGRFLIVSGHYAEIVPEEILETLVVLRTDPRVLAGRLCSRGWDPEKVLENVESEYLGVCLANALEEHSEEKVCEIDTTSVDVEEVVREILKILRGEAPCSRTVEWSSIIEPREFLEKVRLCREWRGP